MKILLVFITFLSFLHLDQFSIKEDTIANDYLQNKKPAKRTLDSFFLGQVYKNGNVYLLATSEGVVPPKNLVLIPLEQSESKKYTERSCQFQEFVDSEEPRNIKENLPSPIGFFETIDRMHVSDMNMLLCKTVDKIQVSYPVLAFDSKYNLNQIDYSSKGKKRPLSKAEQWKVTADKKELKIKLRGKKCTTDPKFFDSSEQLWSAKFQDSKYTLRISKYSNAGCLGHLSINYVLDLLKGEAVIETAIIQHYFGVI